VCGVLIWGIAEQSLRKDYPDDVRIYAKRIAGACGFFLKFAVFHVIRSVIKALTDTTLVLFCESEGLLQKFMSPDDVQRFRQVYEQAARHPQLESAQSANPMTASLIGSEQGYI
jgi:hypothetical protein